MRRHAPGNKAAASPVVADEVRKLAERTRRATKEIAQMIENIQTETQGAAQVMQSGTAQVKLGVESTTRAGASLREIIQTSEVAGTMVTAIAAAAAEQKIATGEINANIEQIAALTQGASAGAKESAKAIDELSNLAMDLQRMVGKFKVSWAEREPAVSESDSWSGGHGQLLIGDSELESSVLSQPGNTYSASAPSPKSFFSCKELVGARRFELLTPCAQGRCATRLRYAPTIRGTSQL